ncbi:MAG: sigma-70 family RNA polymerase sigma factor [Acutalibacteraceae bacterium]
MMLKERNQVIEQNIGLVHACAGRFKGRGVEYEDLFQAGCVGLCKAADGFDESKGFAFSTYAVPTILGEIRRIFRDGGTVKVGRSLKEKARHVLHTQETLTAQLGREPTISELAQEIGCDTAQTAFLLNAALPAVSLTFESEEEQMQADIPVPSPDTKIEDTLSLYTTLDSLNEKERKLIELRFFKGLTQTQTAEILHISQVQVSRKEKAILQKMRREMLR